MAQQNCDLLIKNGKIIDGTGNSWFYGDIAVKDGKIMAVGKIVTITMPKKPSMQSNWWWRRDSSMYMAHIESGIRERPTADNYIYDGVTTVITGNCGGSAPELKKFFAQVDSMNASINVASLVGHNTVREQVMKRDNRLATPEEQLRMDQLVEKAMQEGAVGLSTGLIYIPGTFANTAEVVSLAKAAGKYNGIYASHIRQRREWRGGCHQ